MDNRLKITNDYDYDWQNFKMFPITIRKCNRLPNRLNSDYIFNATSFNMSLK